MTSAASTARAAPAEALVARAREIEQQARGAQVRLLGVVAHGFITHQAAVTTPVDVPENGCLALVALGSTGLRDLDAHLFDPAGALLVEDVETDPHPTVQLCTTAARRVYHVLDAYEGNGAYAVAAFVTDRAGLAEVARVVGGQPGMAVGTGGERSEIERRMNELRDGIARRGFQPVGGPSRADFAAAGARRVPIPVTPDRCYTFAAVADGEVRDADLVVYDANGEAIARGEWADPQVGNRGFAWARVDLPGPNDLWVISVHLLTSSASERNLEAQSLVARIDAGIPAGDYVLLGGDFNTNNRTETCFTTFARRFRVAGPHPVDQRGDEGTNANRDKPYDNVVSSPCLARQQVPTVIGSSTYPSGLVVDTTVYTPLSEIAPAQFGDSNASQMQHMGVVKDFLIQP